MIFTTIQQNSHNVNLELAHSKNIEIKKGGRDDHAPKELKNYISFNVSIPRSDKPPVIAF